MQIVNYYHPQRSRGKVIFSEVCAKNSVHRGVCVAGGHGWQGACMVGGMCGRGHAWQGGQAFWGACVAGPCVAGGMCGRGCAWWGGHVWQGGVHGRGCAWQGGHAWQGDACPLPPADTMRYGQ